MRRKQLRGMRPTLMNPTISRAKVSAQANFSIPGISLGYPWDIAEVIVYLTGTTVGQLEGECSWKGGPNTPKKRGAHGQDGTRSVIHDYCVAQTVAYGNKAVIGHYRVQETLCTT